MVPYMQLQDICRRKLNSPPPPTRKIRSPSYIDGTINVTYNYKIYAEENWIGPPLGKLGPPPLEKSEIEAPYNQGAGGGGGGGWNHAYMPY